MKKSIALLFTLLMIITMFSGCNKDKSDGDAAATSSAEAKQTNVVYVIDGESVYTIVKPEGDDAASSAAIKLFKQYKTQLGTNCKQIIDTNEEASAEEFEILVGNTNRPESAEAMEILKSNTGARYNDYIICTIGNKIVINSKNSEQLSVAVDYFIENYLKAEGVAGGIEYFSKVEGNFADVTIAGVNVGEFSIVKPYYNISYLTQLEIDKLVNSVYEKTGFMIEVCDDQKTAAKDYEIIIGNTNRDGVESIKRYDDYSIKVLDKKVYLNGGSAYATAVAVTEFAKMLNNGAVTDADNVVGGSYREVVASYDAATYFKPTWIEDFDYVTGGVNGIDTQKWRVLTPGQDDAPGHNNRTSVRLDSADVTYVKDGKFYISAAYDTYHYYGAKLVTKETMVYRYGYIEMSAQMPHGDGFWVSLWMNSKLWDEGVAYFTEINVTEMFGNSASAAANCHGWKISSRQNLYDEIWAPQGYPEHWSLDGKYSSQKKYVCPDGLLSDTFHTYGYYWTEDECTFICDGNVYFSVDLNEDPVYKNTLTQPLYLILSEAVCFATGSGRNMPDNAPEWTQSNDFIVDYIHIYQLEDGKHELRLLK